jgi:DNA-binding NarL/FixJ family response regulator
MTDPLPPPGSRSPTSGRVTAAKRYGVFLVEDHPATRAGLAALVDNQGDLYICGGADNAPDALLRIAKLEPSVVVTDITLRTSNGLELMTNLMKLCPTVPVLAISGHDENVYAEPALRAGARGYLSKESVDQIVPAIRTVLAGEIYLSARLRQKLYGESGRDVPFG